MMHVLPNKTALSLFLDKTLFRCDLSFFFFRTTCTSPVSTYTLPKVKTIVQFTVLAAFPRFRNVHFIEVQSGLLWHCYREC